MIQQGQVFKLKATSGDGEPLWAYRYRVAGPGHSEPAPSIPVVQGKPAAKPFDTVVVQPGSVAAFDIFGPDYDALANRACPKTRALLVAAPGVAPSRVTVVLPFCGPFYIAPLIAGKTDRNAWSAVWAARWCRIQQFTVSIGRRISEATGQHTLALRLTTTGPHARSTAFRRCGSRTRTGAPHSSCGEEPTR